MKIIPILLLLMISDTLFGGEFVPMYKIISDTIEEKVPEGRCLVYGKITLEKTPVSSAKVSTIDHKQLGVSDDKGKYSFYVDAQTIQLYAFKIGHQEVIVDKHQFREGYSVHIDFYMKEDIQMEVVLKPVIYAYSPSELSVKIKMDLTGDLTFSYPKYDNSWDIVIEKDGLTLQGKRNEVYPYLFWEGETSNLSFQSMPSHFNGYQIKTDSTIGFLEEKCKIFGFNTKEATDFITFWGPRIQRYPYAKIEFLVDSQYDIIGKLEIQPKPDNIRRVYILFQGKEYYESNLSYKSVSIEPISREGFTVIEWGGTEFSPSKKITP